MSKGNGGQTLLIVRIQTLKLKLSHQPGIPQALLTERWLPFVILSILELVGGARQSEVIHTSQR